MDILTLALEKRAQLLAEAERLERFITTAERLLEETGPESSDPAAPAPRKLPLSWHKGVVDKEAYRRHLIQMQLARRQAAQG